MGRFIGELDLRFHGADHWELLAPFGYETDDGVVITAPKGMITDLASVPDVARSLVSECGVITKAAVIHDYLYVEKQAGGQPISREYADDVMLEAMTDDGVDFHIRNLVHAAVRLGGGEYWNS